MIGERILRARKGAGLSQDELAKRIGVSKMSISKYERGVMAPSSRVLIELSRALSVRAEFFLRSSRVQLGEINFRKRQRFGTKQQEQLKAEVIEKLERFFELMSFFPNRPCAGFERPADLPSRIDSLDDVERAAESVRAGWQLGTDAIQDLSGTFERQGIVVVLTSVEGQNAFDGLSTMVDETPVVVIGKEWPGDRQRFTLAHELGHLMLDDVLGESIHPEKAANRFAGAFLVPAKTARCALGAYRTRIEALELADLKMDYGLSMAGWLYRACDLEIIGKAHFRSAMKLFRSRGWHRKEPGESLPPEKPRLFHQLVQHALAEEMVGVSKAAELLGISVAEFRKTRRMEVAGAAHQ